MRWVLMTPLGWPVEPDVNMNFAIVSGPTLAKASSTASVGGVFSSSENSVARRPGGGLRTTTISTSGGTIVRSRAQTLRRR